MYTTIDFDKYKVSQDSLEGTEKIAAGIKDTLLSSVIGAASAKGAGKLFDKIDDAILAAAPTMKLPKNGTPEELERVMRNHTDAMNAFTARRNLARQQLATGAAVGAAYQGGKTLYHNRKAIKDMAYRAVGKNPNKNRDRALAAAGIVGAGGLAYTGARYNQLKQQQANFDRQYGYGDYYGKGTRTNPYEKYASVEDAFVAGYESAMDDFVKEAGFLDSAKKVVMAPINWATRRARWVADHPNTVMRNIRRSMNKVPKLPSASPAQAWNSMSTNAKWMTGTGIAGLGAAAYHQGSSDSRTFKLR